MLGYIWVHLVQIRIKELIKEKIIKVIILSYKNG